MCHPQALGQQKLELGAEPLTPMAQVGALVRKAVLEELLASEVLEIGVIDPALAHLFVGQTKDVLEQHQSDHEAGRNPAPTLVAVERRDLLVEMLPIEPAGELDQLVLHVADLIEPGPAQLAFPSRLVLLRPHRRLRCDDGITVRAQRESKNEIARFRARQPENLAISKPAAVQKRTLSQPLSPCSRTTIERLAFIEGAQAGTFHCRDVDEHILASALQLNESVALRRIEPLHVPSRHRRLRSSSGRSLLCEPRRSTNAWWLYPQCDLGPKPSLAYGHSMPLSPMTE